MSEKEKGLRCTDASYKNSHRDVKYNTGNIVNNIVMIISNKHKIHTNVGWIV